MASLLYPSISCALVFCVYGSSLILPITMLSFSFVVKSCCRFFDVPLSPLISSSRFISFFYSVLFWDGFSVSERHTSTPVDMDRALSHQCLRSRLLEGISVSLPFKHVQGERRLRQTVEASLPCLQTPVSHLKHLSASLQFTNPCNDFLPVRFTHVSLDLGMSLLVNLGGTPSVPCPESSCLLFT